MQVGAKTCVGLDAIFVDDTKRTVFLMRGTLVAVHNLRTYMIKTKSDLPCEREGVEGLQPTMISQTPISGESWVDHQFGSFNSQNILCFLVAEAPSLQAVVIHVKLRWVWVVTEDMMKPEGLGETTCGEGW